MVQNKLLMNKKQKNKIILLIAISIVILSLVVLLLFIKKDNDKNVVIDEDLQDDSELIIEDEIINEEDTEEYKYYQELWKQNEEINSDHVGQIVFKSGLIDLPFVCPTKDISEYRIYIANGTIVQDLSNGCESGACTGNDVYLRTDWQTGGFNDGGSLFMDYRNTIYDQNIIIYGHNYARYLDENREKFFTPLEKLMVEDNYEDNKYIKLVFENDVRYYEIVYVYTFDINGNDINDLQYYRTFYDYDFLNNEDPYYSTYIENVENRKLYSTGESLSVSDKTLTLQTCVEGTNNLIEIVVAKEIDNWE